MIRDRDAIYGKAFQRQARALGIEEVPTAPQSPWQNPYVERVIGSIRRECLDHVIVLGAGHLRRILSGYADHYNGIHALKGDLEGHWAVWVSGNWRLTFRFERENAVLVDYRDYH